MVFTFIETVKYKKMHILYHVKYRIVFVLNVSYQNFYILQHVKYWICLDKNEIVYILHHAKFGDFQLSIFLFFASSQISNLSSLWTSNIKFSIFWIIQKSWNLQISRFLHCVPCKTDLHYGHEILQFLYFALWKIWKLENIEVSILRTTWNMELSR